MLDEDETFDADDGELSAVEFDADAFSADEGESAEIESTDNEDVDPGFSDFLNQIGH